MDAGLCQFSARIRNQQALFNWDLMNSRTDSIVDGVRGELLLLVLDSWSKSIAGIEEAIGKIADFRSKPSLWAALDDLAIQEILDIKARHSPMQACPLPSRW